MSIHQNVSIGSPSKKCTLHSYPRQFLVLGVAKQICVSWLLSTFLVEIVKVKHVGKSALKIIGPADHHDYDYDRWWWQLWWQQWWNDDDDNMRTMTIWWWWQYFIDCRWRLYQCMHYSLSVQQGKKDGTKSDYDQWSSSCLWIETWKEQCQWSWL